MSKKVTLFDITHVINTLRFTNSLSEYYTKDELIDSVLVQYCEHRRIVGFAHSQFDNAWLKKTTSAITERVLKRVAIKLGQSTDLLARGIVASITEAFDYYTYHCTDYIYGINMPNPLNGIFDMTRAEQSTEIELSFYLQECKIVRLSVMGVKRTFISFMRVG